MSSQADSLPTDPEELKAQIAALQEQLAASEAARKASDKARAAVEQARMAAEERARLAEEAHSAERHAHVMTQAELRMAMESIKANSLIIEKLKVQLARLKRQKFGQSSERLTEMMDQLELTLEDLEEAHSAQSAKIEASLPVSQRSSREKRQPKRLPLPDHLERQEVIHPAMAGAHCEACGSETGKLGEDVTEILEYTPARFYVVRHVRPKMACKSCDHIQQAHAPANVVPRGRAGPNLLAHVLVSKFADHLPLYRQSAIYKRDGVDLSRSTLADWVGHVSWLLQPLVDAIADHVMASGKIHTDDTPVKVLAPGTGKTKTGRFWVYARDNRTWHLADPPAAVFFYSPDRKSDHPARHLHKFSGFLQADAYVGYDRLYDPARQKGQIVEVACWAHSRRKLHDVLKADPQSVAADGIRLIRQLYDLEDQIRGADLDTRRGVRRQSRVIAEAFFDWATNVSARISAKSALAGALNYALSCKDALLLYTDEPTLEIDNNRAENSLRGIALGRKNYLFAGADVGGERAAAVYSLIETAKLNNVDPQAWLADVLQRIADGHPINAIKELLPWNWARTFGLAASPRRPDGVLQGYLTEKRGAIHSGLLDAMTATQLIRVLADLDQRPLGQPAIVEGMKGRDGWVRIGTIREVDVRQTGIDELVGVIEWANKQSLRFRCDRQADGSYDLIYVRPSGTISEAIPDNRL